MGKQRKIRVTSIRHAKPDLKKLSRALIELAQAQAEAEAQAKHEVQRQAAAPQDRRPA